MYALPIAYPANIDLAYVETCSAVGAGLLVDAVAQKREPVEKRIQRAEGAEKPAERTVDEQRDGEQRYKYADLPVEQRSEHEAKILVHGDERNARFKGASGAEVGAKRRRADARSVEEHNRRNDDEAEQDDVLAPGERTAPGALSDFGKRYLVE